VAFVMALVAFGGMWAVNSPAAALGMLSLAPYTIVADYMMSALPLFVLMGAFAYRGSIITDAYTAANKWLGWMPGGLSIATIAGCAGFAACTGSSAASVGFMTMSALPEMERHKYAPGLSTGTIAAGSTLGILIPPSIPLIIYGIFAQQSVGRLFIAGIVPGVILTLCFMTVIFIWVKLSPTSGPRAESYSWRMRLATIRNVWPILLLALLVLGGIWGGWFTPVEAGGIGAVIALIISMAKRQMNWRAFLSSLYDTAHLTGMVFAILIGALMLNRFLATTGLPTTLANAIATSSVEPWMILIIITVFYIIGGCLMDSMGLMLLTMPILIPIVDALGVDMIMYGILMVMMISMAAITPPIGMNVFIVSGMAKHIPMYTIFRGVLPFFLAMLAVVMLIIAFPELATFLPTTMMK
jgi:C4-dicarboxylate transporter, DctM subunit